MRMQPGTLKVRMTPIHISTAFDSGAIDVVSAADPADVQISIRCDNASRFAQWFHFSMQGYVGQAVMLDQYIMYFAYLKPFSHERHLHLSGRSAQSRYEDVEHLGPTLYARDMTKLRITKAGASSQRN